MIARPVQGFFVSLEAIVSEAVIQKLEILRVELKYCEACGALWLRAPGSTVPYCQKCEPLMSEMAGGRGGRV